MMGSEEQGKTLGRDWAKKAPANSAMTGSFAPQGMKGASMAVARRSRSLRMVRQAITPGIAQPVPTTKGITDLPERPTFLKTGSRTTVEHKISPTSGGANLCFLRLRHKIGFPIPDIRYPNRRHYGVLPWPHF